MGIWEFCFYKFRHPDYQFDHLFHGCHPLYGEEFRLIREKLLPGWLMVVQLFITISLILRLRPFVFLRLSGELANDSMTEISSKENSTEGSKAF